MANTTIKYKQLYDEGEPFYPMVGKSSYPQWLGYEEVSGDPPTENFVTPVENGGTGADNASDARANLGITNILSELLFIKYFSISYTISGNGHWNSDASFITIPSGYSIAGIVGLSSNDANVIPRSWRYNGNSSYQYSFELRNIGSASATHPLDVWVLFVKTEYIKTQY